MWVDMIAQDLLAAGKKQSVSWPYSNLRDLGSTLALNRSEELTTSSIVFPIAATYNENTTGFASVLVQWSLSATTSHETYSMTD